MEHYELKLPSTISVEHLITAQQASQVQGWGLQFMQTEKVHKFTKGEGSDIFILDTAGEFHTHEDLKENCNPKLDKDFTGDGQKDKQKHGTHCAGIAAAADNKLGVVGIAPKSKIIALKCLNDRGVGRYAWIIKAIDYIIGLKTGKRKIISMSLSGPSYSKPLHEAIKRAHAAGCFMFVAAGNNGHKQGKNTVGYPAKHDEVISVASITPDGVSHFSSSGEEVDVAAPGSGIYSTVPPNSYARMNGTSMAAPLVAGIGALILDMHPNIKNNTELRHLMTERSSDWWTEGFDNRSGYGVPFPSNFLRGSIFDEEENPKKKLFEEIKSDLKSLEQKIEGML